MKLKIALLLTLVAIGIHSYLTLHYYDLNYGMGAADSICNISAKLNCDAVAASSYSTLLKAPLALWGAVTNLMLLVLLLGWLLGWTNDIPRLGRYSLWFSGLIALASIVMGTISIVAMSVFCVFCIVAYAVSFLTFYFIYGAQEADQRPQKQYLRELFTSARIYLVYLLAIPLLTLFFNHSMASKEGPKTLQRLAKRVLGEWRVAPVAQFSQAPLLVKGANDETAKVTITEFADFRCGHCKVASTTVKAFLSSRPDVQIRFYAFPLDKACNDSIDGENGISCALTKAVACAEQGAQQGWAMHDLVFAHQDAFNSGMNLDAVKTQVNVFANELKLEAETFKTCLESPEIHERIKKSASDGAKAGIKGTPTFFVNGKKLEGGQVLPILEAAYSEAKSQASTK